MRVLALGNSDSSGAYISGPTWSQVARIQLEERLGEQVQFDDVPYSVTAPTALSYAEKKIAEAEPDVVVVTLGSYPFTAGFTWVRVRALFGERAGRWYRHLEERFEKETRERGLLRDRINRFARKVVPRVVGTQPMTTREQLTESYRDLFRVLSHNEGLGVVVVTYPGRGAHAKTRKAIRERAIFFPEMEAVARSHRFAWVDGVKAFDESARGDVIHTGDGLHFNESGHEVLGGAVARAIAQHPAAIDGGKSVP